MVEDQKRINKMNNITVLTDGVKVYDPRIDKRVVSNNPALILGHLLENFLIIVEGHDEINWEQIARMATFCDQEITSKVTINWMGRRA